MTDFIKNICTKTETLYPNVIIHDNPTIANGVVSGFSALNYLDLPDNYRFNNNAEYVIKFTTASTTKASTQTIFADEYFCTLEIQSETWEIYTYDWFNTAIVNLFTASANTTYWVKILINGQTKTFSYSTDGENYTQVANFTDTDMLPNSDFPTRIGNHSVIRLLDKCNFLGSVDLNETYINVDGERVWSGMDYKKYYPIGGNSFKGQFVPLDVALVFGVTIPANTSIDYDISSYLPNDEYDYEVLIGTSVHTVNTAGNMAGCMVLTKPSVEISEGNSFWWYGGVASTRANNFNITYGSVYCYVPNSYKHVIIRNNEGSAGTYYVRLIGYRRANTNNKENVRYISNINDIAIGGNYFDGAPTSSNFATLYDGSFGSSGTTTIDLSSIFPDDNYYYMLHGRVYVQTGSASGNITAINMISSISTTPMEVCSAKTTTSSTEEQKKAFQIPVGTARDGQRTLTIGRSSGTNGTGHLTLNASYIRRIGYNE